MGKVASSSLSSYLEKRDFTKTSEPKNSSVRANRQLIVQQHFAKRLHFDLRLEIKGVLASWAVTRGPSANPKDKRLAVRTEDHPLSYGNFEGTIPKGQYGGGTVLLWEYTTYTPLNGDPEDMLAKGEIKFESQGGRLKGKWVLVRMKTHERNENWLLIKERDAFTEADDGLIRRFTTGVTSDLTVEEIAAGQTAKEARAAPAHRDAEIIAAFIAPELCESSSTVPVSDEWAFELKYDGYRLMLAVGGGSCIAYTRNGLDWSEKFPGVVKAAALLPCRSAVIDTEAVVLDSKGMSDFPALVSALETNKSANITGIAFDILRLDGKDLRTLPYVQRKKILGQLLPEDPRLKFGDYIEGAGEAMLLKVSEAGGEGIIAKRLLSAYRSGRHGDWLKIKTDVRADVDIIGFMKSEKGAIFASLLAARTTQNGLAYAGRIGTGYSAKTRQTLAPLLQKTVKSTPVLTNRSKLPRGAQFLAMPFAAEVRFGGWTSDGQLRQARFISVQNDRATSAAASSEGKIMDTPPPPSIVSWSVTHAERLQYPADSVTKGDIANYYRKIWPRIAPHLAGRPVSLLRVPDSIEDEVFFQRHPLKGMLKGVQVFGERGEEYFALDGERGLATAVQFGTIELHGWNAVLPDLSHPDRMIFDLDPDEELTFAVVKSAAVTIRKYLAAANLNSWPLLSGGKGIHVVVPLNRRNTSADVEFFCEAFAKRIAQEKPQKFVATLSKAKRQGKILIDYLRNRNKATAVIPWSVRARAGATIASPVTWSSLRTTASPRAYGVSHIPRGDPWKDFWTADQAIAPEILSTLRKAGKKQCPNQYQ